MQKMSIICILSQENRYLTQLTVSIYHEESPTKRQQHKEQQFTDLLDGHSQ